MPYGTIKVDNIIFTNGGSDQTVTVSGIVASTSGNLTVTGTISGGTVVAPYGSFTSLTGVTTSGTNANFQTITGAVGVYTTSVSGLAVNALTANIVSGVFASGTAAAPSITFTGSTAAGIYSPGANQVAVATSGTGRLFVNASGLVGIGTSSPAKLLHVQSGSVSGAARGGAFTKTLFESSDATATYWELQAASTATNDVIFSKGNTGSYGIVGYDHVNDYLRFYANSAERLRITSAGLVGIGTSSPSSLLHLEGSDGIAQIRLQRATTNIYGIIRQTSGPYGLTYDAVDGNAGDPTHAFRTSTDGSTFTERLRIDSSGRVGIGTTSPSQSLEVTGNIALTHNAGGARYVFLTGNNTNTGKLVLQAGPGSAGYGGALSLYGNSHASYPGSLYLGTGTSSNGSIIFGVNNALDPNEAARIDSSGRLLVGTSTAVTGSNTQYGKLQVLGNTAGVTSDGRVIIGRGESVTSSGTGIGQICFTDSTAGEFANIKCESDAASGSSDYPGRLVFSTTADGAASPTERMRITSTGYFKASNTGSYVYPALSINEFVSNQNAQTLRITNSYTSFTDYLLTLVASGSSSGSGYSFIRCDNSTGNMFNILGNGNATNVNNSYGAISDVKLKENIVDASSQWSDLKALQVRKYNFKKGQTHTQIGLVAQEVELVSPGLVSESPDRDEEGNDLGTVTKSVNYSVLYMKAVKALQEAMERIETLEARLTAAGIE